MVCVTTHQAMFKGDRRAFLRAYATHFPNTLRRPALRAKPASDSDPLA
jgi:hypothetical protein